MEEENNDNNRIKHIVNEINKFPSQDKVNFYRELIQSSNPHDCYQLQKTLIELNKGNLNLISHLPKDLGLLIFNYLEGGTLLNCLLTCRAWYDLLQFKNFWKAKYFGLLINGEEDPLSHWDKISYFQKYLTILNRSKNWKTGLPNRTSTIILPYTLDKSMILGPNELLVQGDDREIRLISIINRWSIVSWKLPQLCILLDVDWVNGLLLGCPYGRDCLVFNIYNGCILGALIGHTSLVTNGTFSKELIITKSSDNTIKFWNKKTYELKNTLQLDSFSLLSLKIIENTNLLLIVNVFGFIKLLDLDTLELIQIFHPLNWTTNNIEEVENNQFKHFQIKGNSIIITQSTMIFLIKFDAHTTHLKLVKVKLHSSIIRCISLNSLGLVIGNISYNSINPSMLHFWNFSSADNQNITPIEFKPHFNFLNLASNNNTIILNGRTNTNTLFWLDFLPNLNHL